MGTSLEKGIRARFWQGFREWNKGYDAWLEWCDTRYEPDAYYNIFGQRLTLREYKDLMGRLSAVHDIRLGKLDNVLVEDGWKAIRYSVYATDKRTGAESVQQTMEFAHFKDNPEPVGVRVVEGWAISDSALSAPSVHAAISRGHRQLGRSTSVCLISASSSAPTIGTR